MKKNINSILFVVGISLSLLTGCAGEKKHDFYVRAIDNGYKKIYLKGQDFDPTGLKFKKYCNDCDIVEEITDFTVYDGEDLDVDCTEVTIKAGDFVVRIPIEVKETYKVSCCGDSLTEGHSWPNEAYPVYINDYASHVFDIANCGRNGISITGYGGSWNNPDYKFQSETYQTVYRKSLDHQPDVITLELGTNDATGWASASATFEQEYRNLIDSYIELLGEKTKFIMIVSPPTQNPNSFGIPNDVIRDSVNPIQRKLAEEYKMNMIDLRKIFEEYDGGYSSLIRNNDGVHLSKTGAQLVARLIAEELEKI